MNGFRMLAAGLCSILLALPAGAQTRAGDEARPRDLQRLQEDLANLDEELAALPARDAHADDLRERAEELREEVVYLKVKMRRHQRQGSAGTGLTYDEVAELRRAVADLRRDLGNVAQGEGRELRLPAGAEVVLRLEEPLSSRSARVEDRVEATVLQPLRVGTTVAVPAGARVRGVVRDVQRGDRLSRGGRLEIDFNTLYLDRDRLDMLGRVVSVRERGQEETAKRAGLGAVLGGVLGSILGGKKGALLGVIIGGGGAVVGSKGEEVELPEGTVVVMALERELVVPRR
jgi:hypothetical protein